MFLDDQINNKVIYYLFSSLIHGSNIYNDLQIRRKLKLVYDYDDGSIKIKSNTTLNTDISYQTIDKCMFQNFTTILKNNRFTEYKHISSDTITNIIPNIFDKSLEGDDKKQESILLEYFEDILSAIVPILGFLFLIICIIKCRKIRMKRVRAPVTLSQLKRSSQLSQGYTDLNTSIDESTAIINSIV